MDVVILVRLMNFFIVIDEMNVPVNDYHGHHTFHIDELDELQDIEQVGREID